MWNHVKRQSLLTSWLVRLRFVQCRSIACCVVCDVHPIITRTVSLRPLEFVSIAVSYAYSPFESMCAVMRTWIDCRHYKYTHMVVVVVHRPRITKSRLISQFWCNAPSCPKFPSHGAPFQKSLGNVKRMYFAHSIRLTISIGASLSSISSTND
jgi:hypothetical protein